MKRRLTRMAGFTLLPVILAMSLIAAIAFLINRDNGINVEMISNQSDIDRARFAAEAGLQAVNANVQDNNCSGFYYNSLIPLTNSNFGGASFTAYANPGFGWPVNLVSTGSYNGTSVTLARNNVIVYKPTPNTYTLQPGPATSYDTYVNQSLPSLNFGAATTLQVGSGVGESLLKFDFSILPTGSKIVQYYSGGTLQPGATLSLYQSNKAGAGSALISAHLITRSWTQGTGISPANGAAWNTYDGINAWSSPGIGYDPTPLATIPYANVITWNNWDISDAVIAWMGNVYPNYGIWIKNFSGLWQNVTYSSSDNSNVSQRPKITVNYLLPCGAAAPLACIAGNTRDDFTAISYTGNSGSANWSNNWTETGESDGPSTGKLSVVASATCASGNCMKLRKDISTVVSLTREANLATAVTATLKFSYQRTIVSTPAGGAITLEISKDGGSTFTLLKTYQLNVTDSAQIAESIDISAYISANTQIRFGTSGSSFQTNILIDNIEIVTSCATASATTVTLNPVADAYIDIQSATLNFGGSSKLMIKYITATDQIRTLLKFDTSSLPAGTVIQSAKLRLDVTSVLSASNSPKVISAYALTESWLEGTAIGSTQGNGVTWSKRIGSTSWTNFGGTYRTPSVAMAMEESSGQSPPPGSFRTGLLSWDLKTLAQEWVDGVTVNNGVLLISTVADEQTMDSKEKGGSTIPQLVITY